MMARVISALTAVRLVAERRDPLEPMGVGVLAQRLGISLSSASRLSADLANAGLLESAEQYGTYRLGGRAIRLSGQAAAPTARLVQIALTEAGRLAGETVCLAAATPDGVRVIAAAESAWTIFVPAEVGDAIDEEDCAIRLALDAPPRTPRTTRGQSFESVIGVRIEVAAPLRDAHGDTVAVVAIRLPRNRTQSAATRARRAVDAARVRIEKAIATAERERAAPVRAAAASPDEERLTAIELATRLLEQVADGGGSPDELRRATGISAARIQRLLTAAVAAGVLTQNDDDETLRLPWSVHGWYRAAAVPTLLHRADDLVAETVRATQQSTFLTVMRRMRSVTLVERFATQPDGLAMATWLGRPCPIQYSDGGPSLLADFDDEEIGSLIPGDPDPADLQMLRDGARRIVADGVLTKESAEEVGQIGVTAPIRDSSGLVVAAACIVGPSNATRTRVSELETAVVALARELSELLGAR